MPMRELLQKLCCAKYIMSLDLGSAFLQMPLEQFSRQWMAFQFEVTLSIYSSKWF